MGRVVAAFISYLPLYTVEANVQVVHVIAVSDALDLRQQIVTKINTLNHR